MRTAIDSMRETNAHAFARLRKWQKAWDDLTKEMALSTPDPAVVRLRVSQLEGWAGTFPEHEQDWGRLHSYALETYQDMIRHYEAEFRRQCAAKGFAIEGEFPNFTIDGLIKVVLDRDHNLGLVNSKKTSSVSLPVVMQGVTLEHKRLWDRGFSEAEFLNKLETAYSRLIKAKGLRFGEYVRLSQIHHELRGDDGAYTTPLFAADLSRLIESRTTGSDEHTIEWAPVRDSLQAVYVYDRTTHNGRFLGLLRFRRR